MSVGSFHPLLLAYSWNLPRALMHAPELEHVSDMWSGGWKRILHARVSGVDKGKGHGLGKVVELISVLANLGEVSHG